MAQANQITRERRTLVGRETTFGTTPAGSFPEVMTEIVFMHDEMLVDGIATEMLENMDARVRRQDAIAPVAGLQMASKFTAQAYLKVIPTSAILTGGGSVASLSHRVLLDHLLGAEHAALGTTVASGASATTFDVASAATLKKGTWILVDGEPTLITNLVGSTVTVSPALSGTPSNGDIVRNGYNYAPAESHSSSLTIQTAFAGVSAAQFTQNGCYGGFKINLPFGQLATLGLDLTASSYTQPANQSITTTSVTDDMSAPVTMANATVLLSTSTLVRGTKFICESVELDLPNQWQQVRDPNTPTTIAAVVDTAGRPRAGTLKIRARFDTDDTTAFVAGSAWNFALWIPYGSGSTQRFVIIDFNNATLSAQPKPVKHGNDLFYFDLEFSARMDSKVTLASETGTDLDFIEAPYRIALL
jgi:hypothetical protein